MFRSSVHLLSRRTLLGIALAAALPVAAFAQAGNAASSSAGAGSPHASTAAPKKSHATSMRPKPGGSPQVKSVQAALNRKEHAHLAVDGVMGAKTRAALEKFQKAHGIKPTGRLNEATEKALGM